MKTEAVSAGFYESALKLEGGKADKFPRIQILTIAELLAGKKLAFPRHNIATFKQAERTNNLLASVPSQPLPWNRAGEPPNLLRELHHVGRSDVGTRHSGVNGL